MAGEISLSSAVRSSLLSLQSTTQLIGRTQDRLSSGLAVAAPVDDAVKFFQAKTLNDRAADFDEKKDGIGQAISSLTAALDGAEAIENVVKQIKGLAQTAKSATSSTISELVTQFNDLRSQIANLASDAEYQGTNLINGTGTTLTVNFSTDTSSTLDVSSVDISEDGEGLAIREAVTAGTLTGTTLNVSYDFGSSVTLTAGGSLSITYAGESDYTVDSGSGDLTFTYGTVTITLTVESVGGASGSLQGGDVLSAGAAISFTIASTGGGTGGEIELAGADTGAGGISLGDVNGQYVLDADYTTQINALLNDLDSALTTLRTKSQTLGTNVALLQTRLDFTSQYVNTLEDGAGKLTLADLNKEGANLLALQTRQQLGISSLSFAGQAEQSILALFR
jgi:flagellin-like hook-associated protein FlgL